MAQGAAQSTPGVLGYGLGKKVKPAPASNLWQRS